MTYEEINKLDIVDYLASIGIHPKQKHGQQYWYISPLREPAEKKPSFKVNRNLNRWWDFSLKEGSTLVDFVIRYQKMTIRDVREKFSGPGDLTPNLAQARPQLEKDPSKKIEVDDVRQIENRNLIRYLDERRIALHVARQYNREIHYHFTGSKQQYYALGLANDKGGWELRNKYHKFTADPKGPSTIKNGSQDVALFEGNFNMLTLATVLGTSLPDFHTTNSAEDIKTTLDRVAQYRHKYLFFDNDAQGDKLTAAALHRGPRRSTSARQSFLHFRNSPT